LLQIGADEDVEEEEEESYLDDLATPLDAQSEGAGNQSASQMPRHLSRSPQPSGSGTAGHARGGSTTRTGTAGRSGSSGRGRRRGRDGGAGDLHDLLDLNTRAVQLAGREVNTAVLNYALLMTRILTNTKIEKLKHSHFTFLVFEIRPVL
jgi:hypothetical protein